MRPSRIMEIHITYVQSFSCSSSTPTSPSPPVARGDSPYPRLAYPPGEVRQKERTKTALPSLTPRFLRLPRPPLVRVSRSPLLHVSCLHSALLAASSYTLPPRYSRSPVSPGCTARRRFRTLKRFFPFPVSLRTSAYRIFCCISHCLQFLSKCSRVCVLYWHHPHWAVSVFFVHFRYWPVWQCPVLIWWKRPARRLGALALAPPFDSAAGCLATRTSPVDPLLGPAPCLNQFLFRNLSLQVG